MDASGPGDRRVLARAPRRMAAALAVLVVVGLVASWGIGCARRETVPPVHVIAVDGLSWPLVREMISRGDMPATAVLMARGTTGRLVTDGPLISPVIWTTVATGRPPSEHGITDFLIDGVPPTSIARRVQALWNIASAEGRRVIVVSYLGSWPAEEVRGVVVSDRFLRDGLTERIFPVGLDGHPDLGWAWSPWAAAEARRLRRFINFDYRPDLPFDPAAGADGPGHASSEALDNFLVRDRLAWVYARDETVRRVTVRLLERHNPDLVMTYFQGVDFVSHGFWQHMDTKSFPDVPAASRRRCGRVIEEYHRYTDEIVADLVRAAGPRARILLLSDHGFGPALGRHQMAEKYWYLSGSHRPGGVFIAAGPGIAAGQSVGDVDALDVAPTVLALLGLPVSREMPGRVRGDLLADGGRSLRIRYVRSLEPAGPPRTARPLPSAADEEIKAQLRALGYIE